MDRKQEGGGDLTVRESRVVCLGVERGEMWSTTEG